MDRQPEQRTDRPAGHSVAWHLGAQWGRRGPLILLGAIGLTVVVSSVALYVGQRMRETPVWWIPLSPGDPAIVQAALDVENGISGELTRRRELTERDLPRLGMVRASDPWAVRLESDQASAWLTERLPKWAAAEGWLTHWPEELAELRLNFDGARIRLGARIRSDDTEDGSYMSATLVPQFRKDGTVWLVADSVAIGRLGLPPRWVFTQGGDGTGKSGGLGTALPEELQGDDLERIFKMFAGDEPAPDPLIRLGDGRRVRLVGIRPEEAGTVLLIFRTEYVERG